MRQSLEQFEMFMASAERGDRCLLMIHSAEMKNRHFIMFS